MKKVLLYLFFLAIGIAAFAFTISNVSFETVMTAIEKVSIPALIIFVLVSLINFLIFTVRWDIILHAGEKIKKVKIKDLFIYRLIGYAFSYITPTAQLGGEVFRVYFLMNQGIKKRVAISSVFIDKVFELTVTVLFIIITIITIIGRGQGAELHGMGQSTEIIAFVMLGLIFLLLVLYFVLMVSGKGFFKSFIKLFNLEKIVFFQNISEKLLNTEKRMITFFREHRNELVATIIISFLCYMLIFVEYFVLLAFFGIIPKFSQLLIITSLPMLAYITPIPGAIGILEALQVLSFSIVGLDPLLAIPTIIILRIRDLILVFGGLILASKHGINLAKQEMIMKQVKES